ncbi:hypothetical protein EDC04DRAFT_2579789, partial [Pisolithus marmoratus]
QMSQIMTDNTSNNKTMMQGMQYTLTMCGIPFDHEGNHLQPALEMYAAVLESDPIGQAHAIVSACRASGQCCQHLKAVIEEGNQSKMQLPVVHLLQDCPTRWSSTFQMIDCVILLNPIWFSASDFQHENADIAHLSMSCWSLDVLHDIHQVLEVAHTAQELLSGECTPTLSMVLPAYELLCEKWSQLQQTIHELSPYIGVGYTKLKFYINQGQKTQTYALAMIVNPSIKLWWIQDHWMEEDVVKARKWVIEAVCVICSVPTQYMLMSVVDR